MSCNNHTEKQAPKGSKKVRETGRLGIKRQFVDIDLSKGNGREAHDLQKDHQKTEKKNKKPLTPKQLAERRKLEKRARYADQREAGRLMWKYNTDGRPGGVTLCDWTRQAMADHVEVVRVTKPDAEPRSFLRGVTKCRLGWVCPICTAAKAETARTKLNALLSRGRRERWHMVMITLTVRHDTDMPLDWLWPRLSAASDDMRRTYAWKQINKLLVGSAKAVEATHGANGWHPHYHMILVFREDAVEDQAEAEAVAETLRAAWMDQLAAQGLTGNDRAFHVQGAAAAGSYLAKWGAAEEITLGHAKQGRKGQRSPWQLLRDSREGDVYAGKLWHDFCVVIKGTHQLRLTPSLSREAKAELEYLEEERAKAIEDGRLRIEPETEVSLASLGNTEWMDKGRHRRVQMLEGAALRTRREAERGVWAARHSPNSDDDAFCDDLIEDDHPDPVETSHNEPEKAILACKQAKAAKARRESMRFHEALDAIETHPDWWLIPDIGRDASPNDEKCG